MANWVALLRGINVGGNKKVPMPILKEVFGGLGFGDVATYINSGNVVFSGEKPKVAVIEAAIAARFGFPVPVVLRDADALRLALARNPYREHDPAKVLVMFLGGVPTKEAVATLDPLRSPADVYGVDGAEIFIYAKDGFAESKLGVDYFQRRLGVEATGRNLNTVEKIVGMMG